MKVLLIIDVLNDFAHPKGTMYTPGGETISEVINTISDKFDHIALIQDWHPANHKCFASNNEGKKYGDVVDLNGVQQVMWHDHCIKNTWGSEPFAKLKRNWNYLHLKGTNPELDSYSAFFENDGTSYTDLAEHLREIGTTEVYVVGLATDFCIKYSVLDAIKEHFNTFVVLDAIRGINLEPKDSKKAIQEMLEAGATLVDSKHILKGYYQLFDKNGFWVTDLDNDKEIRKNYIIDYLNENSEFKIKYTW